MSPPARPLVAPALALATGIGFGDAFPGHPLPVLLVFAGLAAAFVRRRLPPSLVAAALLFPYGYAALHAIHHDPLPAHHVWHSADGRKHRIIARVSGRADIREGRYRFVADVLSVDGRPATGPIRVSSDPDDTDPPRPGNRVEFTSSPRPIRDFATPGAMGYARRMALRGIRVSAYARDLSILDGASGTAGSFLERQREAIASAIGAAASSPVSGLLRALVLGQKDGISEEWRDRFAAAGVAHLLAISGLHVGIVAAASFWLFRWLLTFFPSLLWRGWVKPGAMILALVPVAAYGLVAGMPAATLRAILMTAAVALAFLVHRDQDGLNVVALAALVMLSADPPMLFDVSFQLSFAAVIAIVMGASRYSPPHPGSFPARFVILPLWIGVLATAGTLPLTMWHFHQASLNGILANLVFIPLLGMAVVPLALAGALLSTCCSLGAMLFLKPAAWLSSFSLWMLPFFSEMPLAWRHTMIPAPLEMALYHGWMVLALLPLETFAMVGGGAVRRWRMPLVVILAMGIACDAGWWAWRRWWDPECHITALDVGQGSATLAELPGGFRMLVDGGGFPGRDAFDVGRWVVAPFLLSRRIGTIDLMVLSHPDADHLNGLLYVARNFSVRTAWLNGEKGDSSRFRELVDLLETNGTRVLVAGHIPARWEVEGAVVETWAATPTREDADGAGNRLRDNDRSLVVRIMSRGMSILIPGDIEARAERELAARSELRSRVLIAPHHGCGSSSGPAFVEAVRPEIVVVSCGWRNRYGCPAPEVLERYAAAGARIYRTDRDGAVAVSTDAGELAVRVHRAGGGGEGTGGNMY